MTLHMVVKIFISAEGYSDLTYKYTPVSTNELLSEEVPVEVSMDFAENFMENTEHVVSSDETDSVEDFLNSITNVSADENAAIDTDNTKAEGTDSNNTEAAAEGTDSNNTEVAAERTDSNNTETAVEGESTETTTEE